MAQSARTVCSVCTLSHQSSDRLHEAGFGIRSNDATVVFSLTRIAPRWHFNLHVPSNGLWLRPLRSVVLGKEWVGPTKARCAEESLSRRLVDERAASRFGRS